MAGFVILQVVWTVDEHIVREEPFGTHLTAQMEQVVVRILRVVIHTFLHFENMDREDAGFTMSQAGIKGEQDIADHHPALR